MKILVVDDEPSILELLEVVLEMDGHELSMASNGREGLEKFTAGTFDLVLTDFNMSQVNGLELARAVKAANANVKVILMSGATESVKEGTNVPACIDFTLDKPVRFDALRGLLAKIAG